MGTERLEEVRELIAILSQTRELAQSEIVESNRDLPASDRLIRTVTGFIGEVRSEALKIKKEDLVALYEEAFKRIEDWALGELDRVHSRPKLLEERERTIASIVNFLNERSERYASAQAPAPVELDDSWPDD